MYVGHRTATLAVEWFFILRPATLFFWVLICFGLRTVIKSALSNELKEVAAMNSYHNEYCRGLKVKSKLWNYFEEMSS